MNDDKKLKGLDEVKADAEYNFLKRVRDAKEKADYEASKRGTTPEPEKKSDSK